MAAVEVGFRKLQKTAYDAAGGSKTAEEAFAALGVSVTDANGDLKGTEALFMETTTALGNVANETEKAALAVALFGRSGTSLLPMLGEGAQGMRAMMEEARRLGLVISGEDAKNAAVLADAWQRVTSSVKAASIQVGAALAPALTMLADEATKLIRPLIDWIKNHQELVVTSAKVIAVVGLVGAGLVALGMAASACSMAIGGVTFVMSALTVAATATAAVLGAILTPAGLVTVAVLALVAAVVKATGVWDAIAGAMGQAWGDMAAAIGRGDIAAAVSILWAGIQLAFLEGINVIQQRWIDLKEFLSTTFAGAVHGIATMLVTGLQPQWINFTSDVKSAWAEVTSILLDDFMRSMRGIGREIDWVMGKLRAQ